MNQSDDRDGQGGGASDASGPAGEKGGGRRAVLAATAVAGVAASTALLPKSWTTPVLRAVLVPAHAQTTFGPPDPPT